MEMLYEFHACDTHAVPLAGLLQFRDTKETSFPFGIARSEDIAQFLCDARILDASR